MPASNGSTASSGPSNTAADASGAAPSSSSTASSTSNMTPVIIGVAVGVGCFIILIMGYKTWKCTRRSAAPLPPKGPLAHDRQRQMKSVHPQPEVPIHSEGFAPFTNDALCGDRTRHNSSQTDNSSFSPSFPSLMNSQANLVPTNEENSEIMREPRPSFGSASIGRHPLHQRKRSLSNAGSVQSTRSRQSSTNGTIRGAPHARHNRVDIVLPQPLAPGLYNNNITPRQSRMRMPRSRTSSRERRFESRGEEYWKGRRSTDGASPMIHESSAPSDCHHALTECPPPVPPLPTGFSTASSTTSSPTLSDVHSPNFSDDQSPNSSGPLLSDFSTSPESGPVPLTPPKDSYSGKANPCSDVNDCDSGT